MALSVSLGKTINDYKENSREHIENFLNNQVYCVLCGSLMGYHGHYFRGIREKGVTICIHRIACKDKSCRHTEVVLPDFLLPYKQYSADEIEAVLIDVDDTIAERVETEASVSTVRRWMRQMHKKIFGWIEVLTQLLAKGEPAYGRTEIERRHGGVGIMERLGVLIEALPTIQKSGNILGAALIHLSNHTCRYLST